MMYCFEMGPLYHTVCVVTKQKDITKINKTIGIELPNINEKAGYMAYIGAASLCIIAIERKTPGVLAHEAVHAVNGMLQKINHVYAYDNDEIMAYSVGYICSNAYKKKHECDDLLEYLAENITDARA